GPGSSSTDSHTTGPVGSQARSATCAWTSKDPCAGVVPAVAPRSSQAPKPSSTPPAPTPPLPAPPGSTENTPPLPPSSPPSSVLLAVETPEPPLFSRIRQNTWPWPCASWPTSSTRTCWSSPVRGWRPRGPSTCPPYNKSSTVRSSPGPSTPSGCGCPPSPPPPPPSGPPPWLFRRSWCPCTPDSVCPKASNRRPQGPEEAGRELRRHDPEEAIQGDSGCSESCRSARGSTVHRERSISSTTWDNQVIHPLSMVIPPCNTSR